MEYRKFLVDYYNEGCHNSCFEILDSSNLFGGSKIEPANYTHVNSEITIDVFICKGSVEDELYTKRFYNQFLLLHGKKTEKCF